jgi:hypothetical protein
MKKAKRRKHLRTLASEAPTLSPAALAEIGDVALGLRALARVLERLLHQGQAQAPQPPSPSTRASDSRRSRAPR